MDKEDLKYINAGILGCSESELTEDLLYDEETDLPLCTSDKQDLLNSMGDTLYHCTPRKNLESIYKNGLKNFWFSDTTGDLKDMVNSNYDYEYTGNELVILYFPKSKLDLSKVDFTDCNNGEDDVWNNYGYYNGTISITEENLLEEELKPRVKEDLSQEVDSEGNQLTQEQINFFRNSKVRDSQGKLLVCYHGSKSSFDTFDKSKIKPWGWYGKGFYFTPSQNVASNYSEGNLITCYLNITNPFYADSSFTSKEEYYNRCDKLYELVGITKEEIDKQDEECSYTSDPYYKLLMYLTHINSSKDINDYVKELGYDGVIGLDAYGEEQELIIFEPNQIKSITNKTPSNSNNINEDCLSDANKTETIRQELNKAYDDLMGNDKTRLYRYREWANNSNNDYKEYIYNDLKKNKDKSLRLWYNTYRLRSGDYDLSYDDFLNTPITLYRATNVNEKDDATNPFFSYAQSKKLAQRFLDTTQRLHNKRTGEIEEIQIKPKDTLGMIPSDEDEIIVPNKAYQSRVNDMPSIVDNVIKYANDNNVKLPYDRDYILTLFNKRDKENVKKLEAHLMNYIDKRKGSKIKESVDNKTFTFPNLQKAIDFFWKDRNVKIETVPIKKLVDDNNLLNDWDLQSYHQRQWDNKKASEFSIDKGKVNSMRISEVPYAVRKKDGKLELGDGRHRTRALYNDGYEYVTLPVITESISKTTPRIRESLLQEGKQDKENFKKWAEQAVEIAYKDRGFSDWERRGNAEYIVNWFENNRKNLKSPQNDYYYWIKEKNVQGAYDELNRLASEQEKKKNIEKKSKEGAKLIYSDNDWKVYEITTYEASVKYGANTKWCISGSKRWSNGENGRGYWDDYTSEGVKFYFFIGKDTKYAIAIYPNGTDFEIFDAQDNSIAYIPNAPIIDSIPVDYYTQNEDRLLLNLVKTGQLPHICSILSSYLWEHDYYTDIYTKSDFDAFLHAIEENVNADYVKWLAVYDGLKDEEWYKQETGEEYEDEWMGDTTNYIYINFLDGYATLDDALTKDNQKFYYDESEYFINDLYECDILCCKDWVGVWLHIDKYIKDETDLINFIKKDIRDNWNYEDFEKVGLSKEYLLGESLEEHLGSNINEAFSYTDSTNVNNLTDLDRQYFDYIYSGQSNKAKKILNKLALDWGALSKGNKPLKLYHGTIVDKDRFTKFDAKKGYNVDAIYFTNVPEVAHHFIGNSNYNSINNRSFNDNALTKLLTNAGRDVNKLLDILNNHLYQNYEIKSQTNDDGELEYFLVDGDGSYSTTSWLGAKIDDETYVRYEWGNKDKPIKTNLPDKFIYDIERYIYYVNNIGQTYCCYLKMNNPLIIDAKKHPFYEVEFEGKELNTETISYLAKERGYDGVIIKNVLETNYANAKCDDYIVFDANQIKSCDLITCNDNGDIIPPSKRFTTSDDIREEMQEHLGSNVELEEDFKSFKQSLKFPLEVYRGLSANSKESIDLKNVGKSWTTNPNLFLSSDTTLGNYISASSCNYILTGYVDEDDVDWEQTETAFNNFSNDYWYSEDEFDYDCECEITLRNGATPKNIKIETREEFYGDDLEEQLKQNVDLEEDYANNIDESLEDFDDEVGVVYHGGIEKSLHKDFRSILWFTEDYDYALDFGENIFICNLNLKNTFIVGNTDGYIRGLIPTQFSTDFTRLANNLKVTPKELLKCNPEAKNIYSIVRTKAFKELCIKNGYDSVETEEFGHVCFGVFNLDQVDIVDTDFEDESTLETLSPMDESIKPNLREELLLEKGTDYKKQAVKIISNSGLFDEETSTKIIEGLFRQDIHAFNHAPAWLEKYLKGIARMLVEYCNGDRSKAQSFLTEGVSIFNEYLEWVKQNREKLGNQLDDEFNNNLHYQDVKNKVEEIEKQRDEQSQQELSKMKFDSKSNYTLVPINSFEEFNSKYGGRATGDGSSDKYAGGGGTAWCHANNKDTYDGWVNNGKNKFFVLQRNDWKEIPFNEESNERLEGKDDYGNSLIAINTNRYGKLKYATLRCNHVGVDTNADKQYETYAELSKLAGFNVEEEVKKYCDEPNNRELPEGFYIDNGTLYSEDDATDVESFVIPNDVISIGYAAFRNCTSLTSITIPNSVKEIGDAAFYNCKELKSIIIPDSVTSIGLEAFRSCSSLTSIKLSNNLASIDIGTFHSCTSLTSIEIPNSVKEIGYSAFDNCTSLTSIEIPNGVKVINATLFSYCSSLTSVILPNSVTRIEYAAFTDCESLKSITIPNDVTSIGMGAFENCYSLTSVTLPNSLEIINSSAFSECKSLTNITIPNSVARIGNGAFDGCSSLVSISIPDSVKNIGYNVFNSCNHNLTVLTDNEYVMNYCYYNDIKYAPLSEYHKA